MIISVGLSYLTHCLKKYILLQYCLIKGSLNKIILKHDVEQVFW